MWQQGNGLFDLIQEWKRGKNAIKEALGSISKTQTWLRGNSRASILNFLMLIKVPMVSYKSLM